MLIDIKYPPQNQLKYDNVPSHIAGEWPGLKSSRWNGSIKIINQVRSASFTSPNPSLPPLGRRHFDEKFGGDIDQFSRKKLIHINEKQDKPRGLRHLTQMIQPIKQYEKKKICTPGKENNKYNENFMPRLKKFQAKFEVFTNEKTIDKELGIRKKIESVEERRNGLPVRVPGDKLYKNPEWSDRYFQLGGLVVGSTNTNNYKKTLVRGNNNFFETLDLKVQTLDPKKTWDFKVKKEDLNSQEAYVKKLIEWEESIFGKQEEKEVVVEKKKEAPKKKK